MISITGLREGYPRGISDALHSQYYKDIYEGKPFQLLSQAIYCGYLAYSDIKRWEQKITKNFTAEEQNKILVNRLTLGTFALPAIACLGLAVTGISSTPLTVTGIFFGVETAACLYRLRSTIDRIRNAHKNDILPDFNRQSPGVPAYYTPPFNTP